MARILRFPNKESESNISVMPNVFAKLLEMYQQKQNEIRQRKINFLCEQAFQYFYDIQPVPEIRPSGVDLPYFILESNAEKRRCEIAYNNACKAMLDVITNNKVDECYSKRIKELKKRVKGERR
ncbi:MAG: hypothetical protein NC200_08465 [Candidatus Gastranaerophilales bacterium]|nr:hypothetical protein [Candidatus Gastranaerophilales bacterium]